jgi:hypothetical protein
MLKCYSEASSGKRISSHRRLGVLRVLTAVNWVCEGQGKER